MTNPVLQIRELLKPKSSVSSGKVVVLVGNSVHVATAEGVLVLPITAGLALRAGDIVNLKGGAIQSRKIREEDIPVYLV